MSIEKPIWEGMCGRHKASVMLVDGTAQPFLAGNPHMFRGDAEAIMAQAVKDLGAQRDGMSATNEALRSTSQVALAQGQRLCARIDKYKAEVESLRARVAKLESLADEVIAAFDAGDSACAGRMLDAVAGLRFRGE